MFAGGTGVRDSPAPRTAFEKTTSNRQEPFVYGSLGGAEVSLARESKSSEQKVTVPVAILQKESSPDPSVARAFLVQRARPALGCCNRKWRTAHIHCTGT